MLSHCSIDQKKNFFERFYRQILVTNCVFAPFWRLGIERVLMLIQYPCQTIFRKAMIKPYRISYFPLPRINAIAHFLWQIIKVHLVLIWARKVEIKLVRTCWKASFFNHLGKIVDVFMQYLMVICPRAHWSVILFLNCMIYYERLYWLFSFLKLY